ncbi:MAG: SagB/ThcOx family dehydrogenase [Proteobacteria bacterium]|nr:SagB/ThcOx family dehydrogenase [Pseudomonadota bacterium]
MSNDNTFADVMVLNPPTFDDTLKVGEAIAKRRSVRAYGGRDLSLQELSNLCYFSAGITEPTRGLTANPTAKNLQEIDLYVVTADGAFRYDVSGHALHVIERGDFRAETGLQKFAADASVNFIYVCNARKAAKYGDEAHEKFIVAVDAGIISAQACLYAGSIGLNSVIRGWIDRELLAKRLRLSNGDEALLAVSMG